MEHQINQPRVFTRDANQQAQIIIIWAHYVMTQQSGKGSNTGKGHHRENLSTRSPRVNNNFMA